MSWIAEITRLKRWRKSKLLYRWLRAAAKPGAFLARLDGDSFDLAIWLQGPDPRTHKLHKAGESLRKQVFCSRCIRHCTSYAYSCTSLYQARRAKNWHVSASRSCTSGSIGSMLPHCRRYQLQGIAVPGSRIRFGSGLSNVSDR